jgi:hypothetical protein
VLSSTVGSIFVIVQDICFPSPSISIFTSFQSEMLFFISSGTHTITFILLSLATSSIGVQAHTTCHNSEFFLIIVQSIGE